MKEWNFLLNVIDAFVYNDVEEKIVFDNSPISIKAKEYYNTLIAKYHIDSKENQKWAFDIALDCVRNMRDEDRDYLRESYDIDFFGYGMYVRNEYIHCAKLHRGFFCADNQCSVVLGFIYTILTPKDCK